MHFSRNYIFGLLSKEFDVHCACDGRDALRTIRKTKHPDLVLSGKLYFLNSFDLQYNS